MPPALSSALEQGEALGQSEVFLGFQERLSRVAPVERPVLLVGERGTGKELAARRLHYLSRRWQQPLVTLNCAALNPALIEAELFGYERGAFTGAQQRRAGRFEAADRGTCFLDEIGAVPLAAQEKVLRVVEYGVFERVGSASPVEVDVRIVGATNADLPRLVREGRFMRDLLDRLAFEVLVLPPLRERRGDIMLLAGHFAGRMALELGRKAIPSFSPSAARTLERHTWPGNIRELKNVVERAVYRTEKDRLTTIQLDPFGEPIPEIGTKKSTPASREPNPTAPVAPAALETLPLKEAVARLQIDRLRKALQATHYNQRQAAKRLGLTYNQFRGLMRKFKDQL